MKKYVKIQDNKCESYMQKNIRVGDTVIVIDGSYMCKRDKTPVNGVDFIENGDGHGCDYQLLTVKATNHRRLHTVSSKQGDVLSYLNNCISQ